jgi:hypothetical protein
MAQTTQIVPTFSFPHVETHVNDYTLVTDNIDEPAVDSSIKECYAFVASKGLDNVWVKKKSRASAIKTYGDSNFKKYGQPLMQALHVLEQDNSSCWMMRVMPENAAYANAILSVFYKADTAEDVTDPHNRKFRIKLTANSENNITTKAALAEAAKNAIYKTPDAEGYNQVPLATFKYTGRGDCGNMYSVRMSQAYTYERDYGIKMYNFEVLTSENGLTKDANYVGTLVASTKYGNESTTLIDDVLADAELGTAPMDILVTEDSVETIYNAYVEYVKKLHTDCIEEYETKLDLYAIPEDMMNGTIAVTDEYKEKYDELIKISNLITNTADDNIPDIDEFDIIFGHKVASTTDMYPGIVYPELLTDDIDTTADDYNHLDYTTTPNLVDFQSVKGLAMKNGNNGYFDSPRSTIDATTGKTIQWTYEDEVNDCYKNAFNGKFDSKILSPRRVGITAFFDANYDYSVKETIVDVATARNDCRVYLDVNFIDNLSWTNIDYLIRNYSNMFDNHMVSVDIHNYITKEYSTNKKCRVTISYFLANNYVYHLTNVGFHIPMVKGSCQLSGHIKDTMVPVIEEYNSDIKERLYDYRLNYFECIGENIFQRAVQNTTQHAETDLLEENNSTILFNLKRNIENDAQSQIYNFADETVRKDFIAVETARYADWSGEIVQSLELTFRTSEYEFNHSILHLYLAVVFRGLTKKVIVEIDLNKRTYNPSTTAEEAEED